jgi:D-beta-D-heptose 7-phosphate kinase/D-beta-D-heptose 1-phosphate adenosyltransferase
VSGYFDPPTPAHLKYWYEAKKLGNGKQTKLVVILNNDEQLLNKRKGTLLEGKIRYPFSDRMIIVSGFKPVDEVVACIDTDETVAKTLKQIRPHIFAKGGDRILSNLPQAERDACAEVGCQIVCGVGGSEKVYGSSKYDW